MTEALTLVLRNRLEEIGRIGEAVEAFFETHGLAPGAAAPLALALDELATNAIAHGFPPGCESPAALRITLRREAGAVVAVLEDEGRPFDPLSVPPPDTSLGLEARPVGGLGVHLVRRLMDEVTYERADGRNRVRLCKRL